MAAVTEFLDFIAEHTLDKNHSAVLFQLGEVIASYDQDYVLFTLISPERCRKFILSHERDVLELDTDLTREMVRECAEHVYAVSIKQGSSSWIHPTVQAFTEFLSKPADVASGTASDDSVQLLAVFVNALCQCRADQIVPMILGRHVEQLVAATSVLDPAAFADARSCKELTAFVARRIACFERVFVTEAIATASLISNPSGRRKADKENAAWSWFLVDFYRGATSIRENIFIDAFHNLEIQLQLNRQSEWYGHHDRLEHADDVWAMLFPLHVRLEHVDTLPVINLSEVELLMADVTFAVRFERSVDTMLDYYFLEVSGGECSSSNPSKTIDRLYIRAERLRLLRVLMSLALFKQSDVQFGIIDCLVQGVFKRSFGGAAGKRPIDLDGTCSQDVEWWIATVADEKARRDLSARCARLL